MVSSAGASFSKASLAADLPAVMAAPTRAFLSTMAPELFSDRTVAAAHALGRVVDVATVAGMVSRVEEEVDPFTIELVATSAGADLVFSWERTAVRVPVTVP